MKKCIAAMTLAGSNHLAKTYEGHLKNHSKQVASADMGIKLMIGIRMIY